MGRYRRAVEVGVAYHAFLAKYTDHGQLGIADRNTLPDRGCIAEQLGRQGGTQYGHFQLVVHFFRGEIATGSQAHIAHGGPIGGGAQQLDLGQSRQGSLDGLLAVLLDSRPGYALDLLGDGGRVIEYQPARATRAARTAAKITPAEIGLDKDQVRCPGWRYARQW